MNIAVLVKQVPRSDELVFVDGRLNREGVELETNAYCRRANAKAVELAGADGEVVVFTMGPPTADDVLREMIACGASRGVHLCDPMFAGSDTLATARALAVAIVAEGPFDLVLCGLNSIDADTGQVGPELAELIGFPFVPGAKQVNLDRQTRQLTLRSETDDGFEDVRVTLPAVVSTAERLCDPSKAPPHARAAVEPHRITIRSADGLRLRGSEIGAGGSPTSVGTPRISETRRDRFRVASPEQAVELLRQRGGLHLGQRGDQEPVPVHSGGPIEIWCVLDPSTNLPRTELLGEAAVIAAQIGGRVSAVLASSPPGNLGSAGADRVVVVPATHASDWAEQLTELLGAERPRIVLVEGTSAGRAVASKLAARHGLGLIGDGIEIEADADGALTVWKPALGGRMVAPIRSSSAIQLTTIRPGVLPRRAARRSPEIAIETPRTSAPQRRTVELVSRLHTDDGRAELAGAAAVLGVGRGVDPSDYPLLEPMRALLGAELGATRKVTDAGWLPRSRQIGITGLSISPHLYISIGASGRFNHTSGFQAARHVLALNAEPEAEIFDCADIGLVGDWRELLADLAPLIATEMARSGAQVGAG